MTIPDQLKNAKRWMLWKSEPATKSGGKPRKVPYYTSGSRRNGELDTPSDTAKLTSYAAAAAALKKGSYTGLGFALGPDGTGNHWQGVDLDDVPARPHLDVVNMLLSGYTETSPSGKGYHAIGYGKPFDALGSNASGIEAYAGGRYFTFTGTDGRGEPCDLYDFVMQTCAPLHKPQEAPQEATGDDMSWAIGEQTYRDLRSALGALRSDDRDLWVSVGQALKTSGDRGRALWIEWSQASDKFDPEDAERVWDSFTATRTGYAAVFAKAQKAGWVNPAKGTTTSDKPKTNQTYTGNIDSLFGDLVLNHEDVQKMADAEFLIPNMIVRGHVHAFVSPGNGGKTTIFIHLCEQLSAQGVKVLYINVDGSPGDLKRHHAHAQVHGYSVIAPDAKDGKSTDDVLAKLQAIADGSAQCNNVVLILDTLKKFVDVIDKRKAKALMQLMRSLTVKGATVCLLGHTNKHAGDDGKQIFEGTGDVRNDVDELIYLDSCKNDATGCLEVTTRPDKVRAEFSPKSFVIDKDRNVTEPGRPIKILAKEGREILDLLKAAIQDGYTTQAAIVASVWPKTAQGKHKIRAALLHYSSGEDPEIVVGTSGRGLDKVYSLPPLF